jgi:hypothetical protein
MIKPNIVFVRTTIQFKRVKEIGLITLRGKNELEKNS